MFKVHINNDFSMAVSDLNFFWLSGVPRKGVMPKK